MTTPAHDDLSVLRAQLAAQCREAAAQRARIARLERRRCLPRRALPILLVALLVVLVPLATLAANPFVDLNPGSVHNPDIDLIYNAGITRGCDPPTYVNYCPNGTVTREEMASFLARTAGLGDNPPVANALTAQLAATAQRAVVAQTANNAQTAENAQNAAQLGGHPPSYYQTAEQPIANAQNAQNATTVGGYAPNALTRVAYREVTSGLPDLITPAEVPVGSVTIEAPVAGFVSVTGTLSTYPDDAGCPCTVFFRLSDGTNNSQQFSTAYTHQATENQSGTTNHVFPVSAGTKTFILLAQRRTGSATIVAEVVQLSAIVVPFGYDGGTTLAPEEP